MANFITPQDLLPCDVLLYQGTSFIAKLIRLLDGSEYNHAAIYFDNSVLEAVSEGVKRNPLNVSVENETFVDVYRFISNDNNGLSNINYPYQPILDKITEFENEGQRYAFEQLILLALLCTVRKVSIPIIGPLLRTILDHATELISDLIAAGKEPMICSELVYRCYAEADPAGKYELHITGLSTNYLNSLNLNPGVGPINNNDQILSQDISEFIKFYNISKTKKPLSLLNHPAMMAANSIVVPDFVTPRDLKQSSNLYKVGTLRV